VRCLNRAYLFQRHRLNGPPHLDLLVTHRIDIERHWGFHRRERASSDGEGHDQLVIAGSAEGLIGMVKQGITEVGAVQSCMPPRKPLQEFQARREIAAMRPFYQAIGVDQQSVGRVQCQ
jgi:hypothetical protein